MCYIKLDQDKVKQVVFTNFLFANNKHISLQIGYVICFANTTRKTNILHWSLIKFKQVIQRVLAAELYKIVHGYDIKRVIKTTLEKLLGSAILLILYTNLKSSYNCLFKSSTIKKLTDNRYN